MTVANLSEAPGRVKEGQPAWTPLTDAVDADLLHGLGALAGLLASASETLNQCLATIEEKLGAQSITEEEWVPIKGTRASVEGAVQESVEQTEEERVFGGVAVTILKLGTPAVQQPGSQSEWQLGYAKAGEGWALMVRSANGPSAEGHDGFSQFSDLKPLRQAPLEVRLKGIREIPNLIKALNGRGRNC